MSDTTEGNQTKTGLVERALGLFTEMHAGEARMALLMTLTSFLILTSYLIAKVVREPLILSGGGAEVKAYLSAVQVGLLLLIVRADFSQRKRYGLRFKFTYDRHLLSSGVKTDRFGCNLQHQVVADTVAYRVNSMSIAIDIQRVAAMIITYM